MINHILQYINGGNLIVGIIAIMILLFIFAVIRYLSDRGGSYF